MKNSHKLAVNSVQDSGGGFIYEFSDGDLSRIQQLLNELLDEIEHARLLVSNVIRFGNVYSEGVKSLNIVLGTEFYKD